MRYKRVYGIACGYANCNDAARRRMKLREPDLRKVRLLVIRALDMLPVDPKLVTWHPTQQAALRVRERLQDARRELEGYLDLRTEAGRQGCPWRPPFLGELLIGMA